MSADLCIGIGRLCRQRAGACSFVCIERHYRYLFNGSSNRFRVVAAQILCEMQLGVQQHCLWHSDSHTVCALVGIGAVCYLRSALSLWIHRPVSGQLLCYAFPHVAEELCDSGLYLFNVRCCSGRACSISGLCRIGTASVSITFSMYGQQSFHIPRCVRQNSCRSIALSCCSHWQ